eukprot:TRINITY_DN2389_c0_g1_i1.p1 TRINITY_DN2389_c0_g1~~TRINITY_DN2389_c0_g1_i1.p1  ORF type:complete len:625 (+),score=114.46 TRINITY_DN2389_c0_g1_i1:64-1875(+)
MISVGSPSTSPIDNDTDLYRAESIETPTHAKTAWAGNLELERPDTGVSKITRAIDDFKQHETSSKIVDIQKAALHSLHTKAVQWVTRYDGTREANLYPLDYPFYKMGKFGVGIGLYYRCLIYFGVFFALASIGSIVVLSFTRDGILVFNPLVWFSAYSIREPDVQGSFIVGVFDLCITALFVIMVWFILPKLLQLWSLTIRSTNVTAAAFSIYVDWLPETTTADDLRQFFSRWGNVQAVSTSAREEVFHNKLLDRQRALQNYQNALEREENSPLFVSLSQTFEKWGMFMSSSHYKSAFFQYDQDLRDITVDMPHNGHAFVTFEYIDDKVRCIQDMYFSRPRLYLAYLLINMSTGKFSGGVPLMNDNELIRVRPAPESEDLIWENMNFNSWDHLFRSAVTFFISLVIVASSFILQLFIVVLSNSESSNSQDTAINETALRQELEILNQDGSGLVLPLVSSLLVLGLNKGMERMLLILSKWEKHHTRSGSEDNFLNQLMWTQVLNTGLVVVLVHLFYPLWSSRDPKNWYTGSGGAHNVMAILLLNSILPSLLRIAGYYILDLRKYWCTPYYSGSQTSLNLLFEGPEFLLSRRFSYLGTNVFVVVM